MIAVAATAVVLAGYTEVPLWKEQHRWSLLQAQYRHYEIGHWLRFARECEQGKAYIEDEPSGRSYLYFLDSPRPRPTDAHAAAEYDKECARLAAICREIAAHYGKMERKWTRTAFLPWVKTTPDPSRPYPNIELFRSDQYQY